MRVVINGQVLWLWRAIDRHGQVLDILLQKRRNKPAAKRFFRRLLKKTARVPQVIVTDKLRSYGAAHREVMPSVEHRHNNPAETSHPPTRERERRMKGFKSIGHAQRFLYVMGTIGNHFRPRRHLMKTSDYRTTMSERFAL